MKHVLDRMAGMNYYYRYYPIDYFFEALEKNQLKQFELWTCTHHFELSDIKYQATKEFKQKMAGHGVKAICLTPEQSNPKPYNLAAKEVHLQDKTRDYLKNAVRAANELEIPLLSLNSGWDFYSEDPHEAWLRSAEMMHEIAGFAEEHGVKVVFEALQPDESHLVNSIHDMQLYLNEVAHDNVFVNIDFGAMARANETIDQYFKAFGQRIRHCHFVDGDPTGHLAWGQGTRDVKTDLTHLLSNDYKGYFTFEFANSAYFKQPFETDQQALAYIRNAIN